MSAGRSPDSEAGGVLAPPERSQRIAGERELSAGALHESETRFRALSESAPLGIFECDPAGNVIYYNPALADLCGRPAADCLNRGWLENIHPDDRAAMSAGWGRAVATGCAWDQVQRLIRPDRSERWVHTLSAPSRDAGGRITGFVGTVEDITQRRMAETALRQSEELFKLVARAVSDVIWDWNLLTDKLWWSDGFMTRFGYIASDIEPGIESWTSRIHPDELRQVVSGIHHAVDTHAESWAAEYRFRCKDGRYAFVQDNGYILRDAAGKGIRMVGGMRDLTEQKKLEAQHMRAQRMESIGTLAGGIAHDLNNVLAPIMMAIELLQRDAENPRNHPPQLHSRGGSGPTGSILCSRLGRAADCHPPESSDLRSQGNHQRDLSP